MKKSRIRDMSPEEFNLFRDFINKNSGIFLDDYKAEALQTSLAALMRQRDIAEYSTYYNVLTNDQEGEEEFGKLLDLITVNETCFFRNPGQFEALRKHVLPELIARKKAAGDKTLRIWSAGCSSGEEPYSIAMTLLEALPNPSAWRIDILATDISRQVLADAQRGLYGKHALRETSSFHLRRYFRDTGNGKHSLNRQVRDMVSFSYHNLAKEPYPMLILGGWDIIFCRNVTIYFSIESVREVIKGFYDALHEGGYLFIGHAESLYKVNDEFILKRYGQAYVYKKDSAEKTMACAWVPAGQTPKLESFAALSNPAQIVNSDVNLSTKREAKKGISGQQTARAGLRREEDKEGLYARAYEHFVKEEFEEAARLAAKFVRADPANTRGRILLANIYLNQGRTERALKETAFVLDAEPMSTKAHYLMGLIREKSGQIDEAVREYKRVLYIDSGFALANLNLANIYKNKHMATDAAREYNSAIAGLSRSARGDWADFAGGFLEEVLIEVCKRNLGQLTKKS